MMGRRMAVGTRRLVLCVSALALGAIPALAAQPSGLAPAVAGEPWQLTIAPYLWATALHGDVGVGKSSVNVDASFNDVLDNLNGALMLSLELRKGRFGLLSDSIFAQLEDNGASERGRIKIDATANMFIQNLAGTYRLGTWELGSSIPVSLTVDPYAGIRYTYLDAEITRSNDGYEGNRPSLVPKHTASLWANYQFDENSAAGHVILKFSIEQGTSSGAWPSASTALASSVTAASMPCGCSAADSRFSVCGSASGGASTCRMEEFSTG